ncbi:serine/threonine-protein kinase [Pendulispora albinea]|uniref:Serine/threonine protein kinase n=1 Tax=Pendulispora albinea TaxID=2741071 RepID=A0ABZ2M8T2_9BACT
MGVIAKDVVVAERFRLVRPIGKGGMGVVWEALHIPLDIPCAVKFIDHRAATEPHLAALQRFEREARAAARIGGRHVVRILDHGVWDGLAYIVMELLRGESLRARLERVGRLSPPELMPIVRHVGRALRKAQESGIVHRDLKPDNIFLTHEDDGEIAKVLDFGIAKLVTDVPLAEQTRTGDLLGTPVYMSPEQVQGTRAIDGRSDLWSLAVIVFRCVTGELPFGAQTFAELVIEICMRPRVIPSSVAVVPEGFDSWWAKAAARDPDDRFQTAHAFVDALELALGMVPPVDPVSSGRLVSVHSIRGELDSVPTAAGASGVNLAKFTGAPGEDTTGRAVASGRGRLDRRWQGTMVMGIVAGVSAMILLAVVYGRAGSAPRAAPSAAPAFMASSAADPGVLVPTAAAPSSEPVAVVPGADADMSAVPNGGAAPRGGAADANATDASVSRAAAPGPRRPKVREPDPSPVTGRTGF